MPSGGDCVRIPWRDSVVYRSFMPAHRLTLIVPLALFAACAHPHIGGTSTGGGEMREAPDESCLLSTGSVSARSPTITIGLNDAVDPRHAPVARNDAERSVFRHLDEAPVRGDCDGGVLPELGCTRAKGGGS